MHLNSTFARASLTSTSGLDRFVTDSVSLHKALDDIVKFNCEVNEFNYMNDLAIRFKTLQGSALDWA
jgi:hypothetical protein